MHANERKNRDYAEAGDIVGINGFKHSLTGYTVWEMNYLGPFQTDSRHVAWTGPSAQVLFVVR